MISVLVMIVIITEKMADRNAPNGKTKSDGKPEGAAKEAPVAAPPSAASPPAAAPNTSQTSVAEGDVAAAASAVAVAVAGDAQAKSATKSSADSSNPIIMKYAENPELFEQVRCLRCYI